MEIGHTEKITVSTSKKRHQKVFTKEVITKTVIGRHKGRTIWDSQTRHIPV